MKRIMVIGCCGAGKSTFAKDLHSKLQLPLIHLDQHYWKPGWIESEPEEWAHKVRQLAQGEQWIIDGNYGGTLDIRLERADTIIYLDASTAKALFRVLKRTFTNFGKVRPDMPAGCPERFSWEFLHYVFTFNWSKRAKILHLLATQPKSKAIHFLKSNTSIQHFLKNLSS